AAREGSPLVTENGRTVGHVTSGSYVPHLQKSIAMGYAEPALDEPLFADVRGSRIPATIVPLPFYERLKN
ncbi:MAG: glycine cleavage T C-terminal barrel domain-containing protein, partial [Gemmataceae bacterium]